MTEQHPDFQESQQLIDARHALLGEFSGRPNDDEVWQQAYDMVRQEGDGVAYGLEHTPAANVGAQELIDFANEMRATPQAERYALTTRVASDGNYWFDTLQTFSLEQPELAKRVVLEHYANRHGLFGDALDLGTGTGKSLWALELVADKVVGLDRNADLLKLADANKLPDTELVQGEVTAMPFADKSFDLISSRGLEGALSEDDTIKLYHEIGRVLRPGGMYVVSGVLPDEVGFKGREMEDICRTSKAMLADMVVDTASGGAEAQLNRSDRGIGIDELLHDAGLVGEAVRVANEADGVDYYVYMASKANSN